MISGSYQVSFNKNSNMKIYNSIFFLPAFLLLAACNSGTPTEEAGHGETEEQHEDDIVTLTESQITAIGIKDSTLSKHPTGTSIKANGRLDRKRVVEGKNGSVRVDIGGRRYNKKK